MSSRPAWGLAGAWLGPGALSARPEFEPCAVYTGEPEQRMLRRAVGQEAGPTHVAHDGAHLPRGSQVVAKW